MKKIATHAGYDYYVGKDLKNSKPIYNIVPTGMKPPQNTGYYDKDYILKIKGVPDLFKQA